MVSVSLDREQLKELKIEAVRGRSYWDRISVALAIRLLDTSAPYFDYFSVLDELDYLEGIRPSQVGGASRPILEPNRTGNFDFQNGLSVEMFKITGSFWYL